MKKKYKQFIQWIKVRFKAIIPGKDAVNGASLGLLTVTAILWLVFSIGNYIKLNDPWIHVLGLVFVLAAILFAFLIKWGLKLLNKVPVFYSFALSIALPLLFIMSFEWIVPTIILVLASICGAVILVLKRTKFHNLSKFAPIMTCDSANEECPFVTGAEKRIPITFEDPKAFDNTPQQADKYKERSLQIATEMLYVFSQINL